MRSEVLVTALIAGLLHSSVIVSPEELNNTTLDPLERSSKMVQLCTDLKSYKQDFRMDELIKTINELWILLYPPAEMNSTMQNDTRITSEGQLNQILTDCGIQTAMRTEFRRPSGLEQAGVIDVRTIEEKNTTHLIIKQRYRKQSCSALIQLMQCMETDGFQKLYPSEKIIALGFGFYLGAKELITDWVALLYQKGEVLEARERAKCLRAKEFWHLKYKDKFIVDYVVKANGTA